MLIIGCSYLVGHVRSQFHDMLLCVLLKLSFILKRKEEVADLPGINPITVYDYGLLLICTMVIVCEFDDLI